MKLILAIVNNDDAHGVNSSLSGSGFSVTKISSTGGFLMSGNSTFIIGVDDDKVEDALRIIKENSKKRQQSIPRDLRYSSSACQGQGETVSVGGATVFVLNVEQFRQL